MATTERSGWLVRLSGNELLLRNLAAALCAACALVYFAIGLGLIYPQRDDGVQLWAFGFSSAAAFALGVVLLLARPNRIVWVLGAAFQAFVIVAYVFVARERQPAFEIWGISLKITQAVILVSLLGLISRDRERGAVRGV